MRPLLLMLALASCSPNKTTTEATEPSMPTSSRSPLWITGSWTHEGGAEHWLQSGEYLVGLGVTRKDGKVVFHEVLSIGDKDGGLVYTALPRGRGLTRFALAATGETAFTAANPAHDFPTSIRYERTGDAMAAQVAGSDGRGFHVDMTRASTADASHILQVDRSFAARVATGGLDAWAATWDPEGVQWTGEAHIGPEDVRAASAGLFAKPENALAWVPDAAVADGEIGMSTGTWSTPGGSAGRYVTVWLRDDAGTWRVLFDGTVPLADQA